MKKIAIIILATFMFFNVDAQNGLKTIEHKVEKGQTLYFISKKYDMSVQDIMRFNPQIEKDMIVKDGMILKIYAKPTNLPNVNNNKYHIVEKGQTLYSLSKMYNISVDDLIYLNQLQTPSISIGDKIIVQNVDAEALFNKEKQPVKETIPTDTKKPATTAVVKTPIATETTVKTPVAATPVATKTPVVTPVVTKTPVSSPVTTTPAVVKAPVSTPVVVKTPENHTEIINDSKDVESYRLLYESIAATGAEQNKEKGIGNFLDQSSSEDTYLALVNGIENGQVIRVRNLMNNKVIYLKVIGEVPQKDQDKNISIKLSKAAARDLKIVEDRFLAEWTWYKKTNAPADKKSKGNIKISDF